MPKNDIGGFFVSLGLNLDKNSFETGNRLIDGVANSFNKLIGSARNAAVALGTTAVATGAIESSAYKNATALGITTEALDLWKASAKIAGVEANALISSISRISNVQNRIKFDGSGLSQLQSQLNKIQMSYAEIMDLSADEATAKILEKAQSMLDGTNTAEIAAYVEDILGAGARDLLIELDRRNIKLPQLQAEAKKTIFTTSADNEKGSNFIKEGNTLKTELESIGKLVGDSVGGKLTPYLKGVNDWIQDNADDIKTAINNISELVGRIANKVAPYTKDIADIALGAATGNMEKVSEASEDLGYQLVADTAGKLTGQSKEKIKDLSNKKTDVIQAIAQERTKLLGPATSVNQFKQIAFNDLPEELQQQIIELQKEDPKFKPAGVSGLPKAPKKVKDGIMRPDGTVTQVAPDDWVFAARNLGDLAQAFTPKQTNIIDQFQIQEQKTKPVDDKSLFISKEIETLINTVSRLSFVPQPNQSMQNNNSYTITQNFTINGGNDIPQVIRQQAYEGTQNGLLQLMEQSAQRLQLMSGTR